jgi:hypothetical protein
MPKMASKPLFLLVTLSRDAEIFKIATPSTIGNRPNVKVRIED